MSIVPPEPDSNKTHPNSAMDYCAECGHGWNFHPGSGQCTLAMANFLCECPQWRDGV